MLETINRLALSKKSPFDYQFSMIELESASDNYRWLNDALRDAINRTKFHYCRYYHRDAVFESSKAD